MFDGIVVKLFKMNLKHCFTSLTGYSKNEKLNAMRETENLLESPVEICGKLLRLVV